MPSFWLPYFMVADVDASVATARLWAERRTSVHRTFPVPAASPWWPTRKARHSPCSHPPRADAAAGARRYHGRMSTRLSPTIWAAMALLAIVAAVLPIYLTTVERHRDPSANRPPADRLRYELLDRALEQPATPRCRHSTSH
jgi:hypothetical protein